MKEKLNKLIGKAVAMVSAIALVVGCCFLSGCGGGRIKNSGDTNLDVEIGDLTGTVEIMLPGSQPNNFTTIQQKLNKKLKDDGRNYTVNITFISWDNYWSRVGLNARGDYDVFTISQYYFSDLYAQGLLADIGSIVEKFAPDYLEDTADYIVDATKIDGKTLYVSADVPLAGEEEMLMTTTKWLERAGMTSITTIAQMDEFLEKCQKWIDDNEETGTYLMSRDSGSFLKREYNKNYYYPLGQWGQTPVYIDLANKVNGKYVVRNYFESDGFKAICDKTNEWYTKGYKPQDRTAFSDMESAFNNGLMATIWSNAVKESERAESFSAVTSNNGVDLYNIVLNPEETMWIHHGSSSGLAVYSTSKRKVQAVDFINLLRRQDYFDLLTLGELGVNYNLDENGRYIYTATGSNAAISPRNKYSLIGVSSSWSTPDTIRFFGAVDAKAGDTYKGWDTRANVKVSPLSSFTVRLDSAADMNYTIIKNAMSKYVDNLTYGYYSRDYKISPNDARTVYEQLLYDMNVNNAMNNLIAAIQSQLDEYCVAHGLY